MACRITRIICGLICLVFFSARLISGKPMRQTNGQRRLDKY